MIKHAYIHIPFCIRKCKYCSFVSGKNIEYKDIYIKTLLKEIKNRYKNDSLKTLYIGGGTPSLLDVKDFELIISSFVFDKNPEITIEANPETIKKNKIKSIYSLGFNRVSLGVQTFYNSILKQIGRLHNDIEIYKAVDYIKSAGFENISIDLIYGLPGQTYEMFEKDLEKAITLDVKHVSGYGLKIEENSFYYEHQPENIPDDEVQAKMYLNMIDKLKENNYKHYEISNFAKKGYESKHNCCYWKNENYYGFGLNASGYEDNIRYKNTSVLEKYIVNPEEKEEKICLSRQETMENEIFLALRLKEGIDINSINKKYNIDFEEKYKKVISKYQKLNMLEIDKNHYRLTKEGILLSNNIMADFL